MSAARFSLVDNDPAPAATNKPAVRIAIATNDMKSLNAHFGSARRFAIYDVSTEDWRFIEAAAFDTVSDESGSHRTDGDDKIAAKIEALKGCHLLFCLAIGGPSAAKVVSAKIHPIKMSAPQPIETVLERTRTMLNGAPPPWLRKVLAEAGFAPKKSFLEEPA
jgi:nitrogen fixation protein NifX